LYICNSIEAQKYSLADNITKQDSEPFSTLSISKNLASINPNKKMETKEIKEILENIKSQVNEKIASELKAMQDHLDTLDIKMQGVGGVVIEKTVSIVQSIKSALKTSESKIKDLAKETMRIKSIVTGSVTGGLDHTFMPGASLKPNALVNVTDLIQAVQIEGGSYSYAIETVTGAVAAQVEGNAKANLDVAFVYDTIATKFIAGVSKVSRQFINNFTSLSQTLPSILDREFRKAENTLYATELFAKATASTLTSGNKIERLVNEVAKLLGANVSPTAVVLNPVDYSEILLNKATTSGEYDIPNAVTISEVGQMRILGVAVVMANWVPATQYLVFDGTKIIDAIQESLNLQIDNSQYFDSNMSVFRIEKQSNIAVTAPWTIVKGDFDTIV
jgi:HK97 family phage major capsid protein